MAIFLKIFQKIKENGHFPNTFYGTSITLISKPDKDTTQERDYRPISFMITDEKSSTKYHQTEYNYTLKVSLYCDQVGLFQECKMVQHL